MADNYQESNCPNPVQNQKPEALAGRDCPPILTCNTAMFDNPPQKIMLAAWPSNEASS